MMKIFGLNKKREIVIETNGSDIQIKKMECSTLELKAICSHILSEIDSEKKGQIENKKEVKEGINYMYIPKDLTLKPGRLVDPNYESKSVGSWGMFNSFFPCKAVLRISANIISEKKVDWILLTELLEKTSEVFKENGFSKLRGFPNNPKNENAIRRLVYHFIKTFSDMGLFVVKSKEDDKKDTWTEPWRNIMIAPTEEGLEFAKIKNKVFDDHQMEQVLTEEEKDWLLEYLKKIDDNYKEYSILKNVFEFIKEGNDGKEALWNWFIRNPHFNEYVGKWSRKTEDPEAFKKQIENLAPTFAASKIALLRELGVIKNRRNDYSIIGEMK